MTAFHHAFWLNDMDRELQPRDYRVSTELFVPVPSGLAIEMVIVP